ncbi:grasp-with-spasm system SPASM domain peptide maturase [Flavobacterium sediminilitoris]|uniref:Grasp-with-spasm system SPASM domain peptide maturase n=1 Tax=Flavobacterium sediminilitoris TaxID=2024526 RepID=A0ABY4HRN7_9FLAO|nr:MULTISPECIES: grasp-with-spasm system SPASM domain peptide maturase [Flavobacterium]UOX35548.1 grasp-with-spasm system SPASM domain peptide maturase [Flavobacterium sediminilitoris]
MLFFKTHTNCKIFRGSNRSIILDIQRQDYTLIPNSMFDIIELLNKRKSINDIKMIYGLENEQIIDEYIEFLNSKEFGLYVDYEEFDFFPEMNNTFEIPSNLSNFVIEISAFNITNLKKIINSLENLMCRNIQFIAYEELEINQIKNILTLTKNSDFMSIELIVHYSEEIIKFIKDIDKYNFRVTELLIHNSKNRNKIIDLASFPITFLDYKINNFSHCGKIGNDYFSVNKEKVLESLNHNSCLNKKIAIDKDGNIKNCPAISQSFGNIKNTTLEEALQHKDFKKYWNITKDQIDICKDCEFRHICTDCRAYIEDPENQYSKPLKCGYDPYTNQWEEWSTNPLKQKAIQYYGMQELISKTD